METDSDNEAARAAIRLEGVGLLREERWILRGVDWVVPAGACVAILGPNGSGKSTLARIVGGHLWPTEGSCVILGGRFGHANAEDPHPDPLSEYQERGKRGTSDGAANLPELRKSIRLLQPAGPYDVDPSLAAREIVLTGFFASLSLYDEPTAAQSKRAGELLELVGLGHLAEQTYARMSSGERVRSLLARALAGAPKLLLLDEPTAGLDLLGREQLLATVQQLAAATDAPTIVIITHHVEELPPAVTQVLLLEEGRVAASGRPREVLTSEILSRVYRCPVEVKESDGRFYLHVHSREWTKP